VWVHLKDDKRYILDLANFAANYSLSSNKFS